jgi:hypothetical protein
MKNTKEVTGKDFVISRSAGDRVYHSATMFVLDAVSVRTPVL